MPRLFIDLDVDEFSRLRDRAFGELRDPRYEARVIIRQAVGLPRTLPAADGAHGAPESAVANVTPRPEGSDGLAA